MLRDNEIIYTGLILDLRKGRKESASTGKFADVCLRVGGACEETGDTE
jgi:hypothetical protein